MTPRILATDALWSQYTSFAPWAWAGFGLLVLLLAGAIGWVIYRRLARSLGGRSEAELMILKGLEGSGSMTEEERKRVRAALARKYMQPTEEPRKGSTGLSPLQQLAVEAQRLEEDARRLAAQKNQSETPLPEGPPEGPQPGEPQPIAQQSEDLPPMLRKLMGKSDIELEDMVAAGLIGEEDLQWVRRARGGQQ